MTLDRQNRFAPDAQRGGDILAGFQRASTDPVNKRFVKRQLKPYKKYGIPQKLTKLKGMSDTQLEKMATKAILKRKKVKVNKLRTRINRKRFSTKKVQHAKRVMANPNASKKALRKTRDTRRHIKQIRRNRRVQKSPIWRGKGYDIWKGYL